MISLLQRFADLQVASVLDDIKPWLMGRRGRVLEVGCGDQPYRQFLPKGSHYQGLDVAHASSAFDMASHPDVTFYAGGKFPFPDASFDALFHTEVLEHVYDVRSFLTECRRVLLDQGELFLTVPFQARYHFIPNDFWRFTPSSLRALLEEAGFDQIEVAPRGTDITVAAYKLVAVPFRWAYESWAKKILFLLSSPLVVLGLAIAHLSMAFGIGSQDDCLGYTVKARAVRSFDAAARN